MDLHDVRKSRYPRNTKPLRGFGGATVLELIQIDGAGSYRLVYTVRFKDIVCVLHVFQKKSSTGIRTSKQDLDIIKQRLAQAEREYGQ